MPSRAVKLHLPDFGVFALSQNRGHLQAIRLLLHHALIFLRRSEFYILVWLSVAIVATNINFILNRTSLWIFSADGKKLRGCRLSSSVDLGVMLPTHVTLMITRSVIIVLIIHVVMPSIVSIGSLILIMISIILLHERVVHAKSRRPSMPHRKTPRIPERLALLSL